MLARLSLGTLSEPISEPSIDQLQVLHSASASCAPPLGLHTPVICRDEGTDNTYFTLHTTYNHTHNIISFSLSLSPPPPFLFGPSSYLHILTSSPLGRWIPTATTPLLLQVVGLSTTPHTQHMCLRVALTEAGGSLRLERNKKTREARIPK